MGPDGGRLLCSGRGAHGVRRLAGGSASGGVAIVGTGGAERGGRSWLEGGTGGRLLDRPVRGHGAAADDGGHLASGGKRRPPCPARGAGGRTGGRARRPRQGSLSGGR